MAAQDGCPVCNGSRSAKTQFATAKVAEHLKEKARRDDAHRAWLDEHTENGTLAQIRAALDDGVASPAGGSATDGDTH